MLTACGSDKKTAKRVVLLEGAHLAKAWLDIHGLPQYCVIADKQVDNPEIASLITQIPVERCISISSKLFRVLSKLEQGLSVIFIIKINETQLPKSIINDCVILDRVQDPGNVGSILRSCAAVGIKLVFCTLGTADVWTSKVLRSGMGAQFQLDITQRLNPKDLLDILQVPLLATCALSANNVQLYKANLNSKCAWVFGNEGSGVDAVFMRKARLINIPQPGGMESLNVAVAAGICLFETLRQRI